MIRLARFLVLLIVIYSLGFISGLRYQGSPDESEALQEHLIDKYNQAKEKGSAVIDRFDND